MSEFIISSPEELITPAQEIILLAKDIPVVCFNGEMGAGKTTLIKVICESLGVHDTTSSPTFSIVNEYLDLAGNSIYHFDFYRIKNTREAIETGALEYFDSGFLCLIEWPELIIDLIPDKHLEININLVGDTRKIRITPKG